MEGFVLLAAVGGGGALVYFGGAWLKQAAVALLGILAGIIVAKFLKPLAILAVLITALVAAHWGLTRGAEMTDGQSATVIFFASIAVTCILAWIIKARSSKGSGS